MLFVFRWLLNRQRSARKSLYATFGYSHLFLVNIVTFIRINSRWIFNSYSVTYVIDTPDIILLQVAPTVFKIETIYLTQCKRSWSINSERIFNLVVFVFLYFGPLVFMTYTYYQIICVLRGSRIPGYKCKFYFFFYFI